MIATVLETSAGEVDNRVTITTSAGSQNVDDVDELVLFRAGFEVGDTGGNVVPAAHVLPVKAAIKKTSSATQKK